MSKFFTTTILAGILSATACSASDSNETGGALISADVKSQPNQTFRFLAIGDHGYRVEGKPKRSAMTQVARNAVENCNKTPCDFALLLGDNIYPKGASGSPADERVFSDLFIKPYGNLGAGNDDFRIYAALGNHDWGSSRKGGLAQLEFMQNTPPFYMDGLSYSVKPPAGGGDVEIFVIDTTMLLAAQRGEPKKALPRTDKEKNQLETLRTALEQSAAKWKFVIGHHPLWEAGGQKATQATAMRGMVLPMLCDYADAYFAGHQHTLEIHAFDCPVDAGEQPQPPLLHVVSGAAAKTRSISDEILEAMRLASSIEPIWVEGQSFGYFEVEVSGDTLEITPISTLKEDVHTPGDTFTHAHSRRFANRY